MDVHPVRVHPIFGGEMGFLAYPLGATLPSTGGVYILTSAVGSIGQYAHTTIYVGQTDDFSTRLTVQHHKWGCIQAHHANCVCIRIVPDKIERSRIEAELIRTLQPTCNDLLKSVSGW
ncbi:MAG: GIY-YIG nuclease family protein [Anaerolineae bacterium]|nr:GIY-YIG nuclease family protein [Anaerolineae bacterium]